MVVSPNEGIVKIAVLCFLIVLVSGITGATTIEKETEIVKLGSPMEVEINIEYSDFESDQVSRLVPSTHTPQNIEGKDTFGSIDCDSQGNEILCEPRVDEGNYSVTIEYETPMTDNSPVGAFYREYEHTKLILSTTERYELRIELPEGFGLIESSNISMIEPETGNPQSEGRQIYVEWVADDPSLGEKTFMVRYEELAVFESFPFSYVIIIALLSIIGIGAGFWIYSNRQGEKENDTIASVLPILKEDEQDVLRYMIEQEGSCEQKAIVQDLSYSKAKVSRLLKDLEERNLVEKIKEGRKNRVELAKEIGDVDL